MIEFIEWTFASYEHLLMVVFFAILLGGVFRPRVNVVNNYLPKSKQTDTVDQ